MKTKKINRRIDKRIWRPLHKAEHANIDINCRMKVETTFERELWEHIWLNVQFEMVDQLEEDALNCR